MFLSAKIHFLFQRAQKVVLKSVHQYQVTPQEATMEQYLEGDSANHSGNKVRDVQLWNPY